MWEEAPESASQSGAVTLGWGEVKLAWPAYSEEGEPADQDGEEKVEGEDGMKVDLVS